MPPRPAPDEALTCVITVESDLEDQADTQRLAPSRGTAEALVTTDIAYPVDAPALGAASSEAASTARHRRKSSSCRVRVRRRRGADTALVGVAIASMVILLMIVLILA